MRVLIYGAGAVGCYIGGHLALAGHDVTFLGRQPLVDAVNAEGLTLKQAGVSNHVTDRIRAVASLPEAMAANSDYDWIAFTMKAYDTVESALALEAIGVEIPPIASFQNGIGNEEALRSLFGEQKIVAGTITTALSMPEPGLVVVEKERGLALASDSEAWAAIAAAFSKTQLEVHTAISSASLKWSKLLLNVLGNATSAILDMSPADVMQDSQLFRLEREALKEALSVMGLHGIPPIDLPAAPAKTLALAVRWLPAPLLKTLLHHQMRTGRGAKMPSLLLALRAGQRKTEVAWLNGAVAFAADQVRRLAPVNHALALIVSDIAAGRAPWEMYRHNPELLARTVRLAENRIR